MTYMDDDALGEIFGNSVVEEATLAPYGFMAIAQSGLSAEVVIKFREYFELSMEFASTMLDVSEPTLYRWIKSGKDLERNTAIKLLELVDLFSYGMEIFGSKKSFFSWLGQANMSLGGIAPQELLEVPEGIGKVRDIVGRIEYGIYS